MPNSFPLDPAEWAAPRSTLTNPVVMAAYNIAAEVHAGEVRRVLRPGDEEPTPYMVHLADTYKILEAVFGKRRDDKLFDTVASAATWLHDVIERSRDRDCPANAKFENQEQLAKRLEKEGVDPETAIKIARVVEELTLAKRTEWVWTKRQTQERAIRRASDAAQIIKIADQISGMVEAVRRPHERFDMRYLNKLRAVSYAAKGVDPLLDALALTTFYKSRDIVQLPLEDRKRTRTDLPLADLIEAAKIERDQKHTFTLREPYTSRSEPTPGNHIAFVDFNRESNITAFGVEYPKSDTEKQLLAHRVIQFIDYLEGEGYLILPAWHDHYQEGELAYRDISLFEPPISVDAFLKAANHTEGLLTEALKNKLLHYRSPLARPLSRSRVKDSTPGYGHIELVKLDGQNQVTGFGIITHPPKALKPDKSEALGASIARVNERLKTRGSVARPVPVEEMCEKGLITMYNFTSPLPIADFLEETASEEELVTPALKKLLLEREATFRPPAGFTSGLARS